MRRLLSTALGAVLTALLVLLGASSALAHSGLNGAVPGPGETAQAGVDRIEMDFAGALSQSAPPRVEVKDPAGVNQVAGEIEVENNHVTLPIEPLKAGLHTVKYQITFDDGHTSEGGYYLTVAPAPPGSDSSDAGGTRFWLAIGGGTVIVILLFVVIALIPRRSKPNAD